MCCYYVDGTSSTSAWHLTGKREGWYACLCWLIAGITQHKDAIHTGLRSMQQMQRELRLHCSCNYQLEMFAEVSRVNFRFLGSFLSVRVADGQMRSICCIECILHCLALAWDVAFRCVQVDHDSGDHFPLDHSSTWQNLLIDARRDQQNMIPWVVGGEKAAQSFEIAKMLISTGACEVENRRALAVSDSLWNNMHHTSSKIIETTNQHFDIWKPFWPPNTFFGERRYVDCFTMGIYGLKQMMRLL